MPNCSRTPMGCDAAMPSAIAVLSASRPSSRAHAAAAPSMPVDAGDVPAAIVVVGIDHVADAARDVDAQHQRVDRAARPLEPRCSASASAADATGPAGWMIVFRCVSSKSNVCDVMPLSSAALADVDALAAAEHGRLRAGRELHAPPPAPLRRSDAATRRSRSRPSSGTCGAPRARPLRSSPCDGCVGDEFGEDLRDRRRVGVGVPACCGPFACRSRAATLSRGSRCCVPSRARSSFAMSSRMYWPNCSGVIGIGSQRFARQPLAQFGGFGSSLLISSFSVLDDRRRQIRGTDDAVPLHAVEALVAQLLERRHVGQQRMALECR